MTALAVFAGIAAASDVASLPRDPAKEAWVRARLTELGLNNEIRVVREEGLTKRNICAYAKISGGRQYVAYDPLCITTLDPGDSNYFRSAGVMFHEIAHHLSGATAAHLSGATDASGKPQLEWESDADRWAGWALRYSGASLDEAMIYARGVKDGPNHPTTPQRITLVSDGWRSADAVLSGRSGGPATGASAVTDAASLAETARRHLGSLRR